MAVLPLLAHGVSYLLQKRNYRLPIFLISKSTGDRCSDCHKKFSRAFWKAPLIIKHDSVSVVLGGRSPAPAHKVLPACCPVGTEDSGLLVMEVSGCHVGRMEDRSGRGELREETCVHSSEGIMPNTAGPLGKRVTQG